MHYTDKWKPNLCAASPGLDMRLSAKRQVCTLCLLQGGDGWWKSLLCQPGGWLICDTHFLSRIPDTNMPVEISQSCDEALCSFAASCCWVKADVLPSCSVDNHKASCLQLHSFFLPKIFLIPDKLLPKLWKPYKRSTRLMTTIKGGKALECRFYILGFG